MADEAEFHVRFSGDLARVVPRPGDVFVLHVDAKLTREIVDRFRGYLHQVLGDQAKVLILDKGMKLEVVGPDDAQNGG